MKDERVWSDRDKQAGANYKGNIKVTVKTWNDSSIHCKEPQDIQSQQDKNTSVLLHRPTKES